MESIKNYIFKQVEENKLSPNDAKKLLMELKGGTSRVDDEIAVIGMACKFPGAKNVDEYWEILTKEINCIGPYPEGRRKDGQVFYKVPNLFEIMTPGDADIPEGLDFDGDIYIKSGYLDEVDKFDAGFFRIPPREAKYMDPQQRVFLETAWEAIEDAGYGGDRIANTKTGVYVGCDHTNMSLYRYMNETDQMSLTGSWAGILATRISYIFNLRGPGMVIDTACSSGLTSVHEACQALKNRECDMAIAGGINLSLSPGIRGGKGAMDMVESSDYAVRTFDNKANGTVWGEGAGVLFLKPLSKAMADGDNIHAVIKVSAINNDGASNGITAPNAEAQEELILQAWKEAGINPETISYIEAHGTGTILGDPIEIKGLTNAFRRHTNKKQFCGIGSVKTNIGHLVAASGLASSIKVILAIKHGMIPATINFTEPNQYINFNDSPVYVIDKPQKWEKGNTPRRAAVNAFGFSGTNCHVIFEEAPQIAEKETSKETAPQILALSARSEKVMEDLIASYVKYVNKNTEGDIRSICYTANTGRGHFTCRLAMIVKDYADLKSKILKLGETGFKGSLGEEIFYKEHKVAAENKKTLEEGEIKESQKREITKGANALIKKALSSKEKDESSLRELCSLYIQGAEFAWDEYYKGQRIRKVNVPVYPLERVRFWAEPRVLKSAARQNQYNSPEVRHPLVEKLLLDTIDRRVYSTNFSISKERHWVLREHKIMGSCVIPGTTYVAIAREACKDVFEDEVIELRDLLFVSPIIVEDGGIREVHIILKKEKGHVEIAIVSRLVSDDPDKDTEWTVNVEGKAFISENKEAAHYNIQDLKAKCNKEVHIEMKESVGWFTFGPRWMNIVNAFESENEALIKVAIPAGLQGDMQDFYIHPALLDNAVNTASKDLEGGSYLPLAYGSAKIYGKMPGTFYSYVRRKDNGTGKVETASYDISLIDEAGNCFMEIENYTVKKVHAAELKFKELSGKKNTYYETGWISKELEAQALKPVTGPVLVLKDASGMGDTIIRKLKEVGKEIIEGAVGGTEEDYLKLLGKIKSLKPAQIIHVTEREENQAEGLFSLLHLTKGLVNNGYNEELDIVLVAANAYAVSKKEDKINPHHAALFGLAKVVSQEYPQLKCRCVDIDTDTDIDKIATELNAAGITYPVAYRKGTRYAAEFRKLDMSAAKSEMPPIKNEGVYIITGGTGGLGLEMAKYLAGKAKTNLALINRSKMPERSQWDELLQRDEDKKLCARIQAIKAIEEAGTHVELYSADIANEAEMKALTGGLRGKYGKINGIIHCAGVAGDGFIIRKEEEVFKSVISPKIQGTWVLDKVTEQDELDFFVMFSSMATLTGGPGQGDYTAANSYLDSFAAYRSRKGKKTLAINWPAWKETGMAVDHKLDDNATVFKALTTAKALEIFEELLNSSVVQAYPGELNYKIIAALKGQFPVLLSRQVSAAVDKYAAKNGSAGGSKAAKDTITEVVIKGGGVDGLSETETKLAHIWARVLEVKEIDIYESFHDLGGDSILATQLLKEIEKEYPGALSISDIFSHPSVEELSSHLDTLIQKTEETPAEKDMEDIIKGEVKLLPAQKAFFDQGYTDMQHWNEGAILYRRDGFDEGILRKVFDKIAVHHDALRMVFKQEEGRVIQYNRGLEGELYYLGVFDFTGDESYREKIEAEIAKIHASMDLANGPLLKLALFKTSEGDHLMFLVHHLVVDAKSLEILFSDAIRAYMQVAMGQEIQLPDKTDSLMRYAQRLHEYAGSELFKELEYWQRIESIPVMPLPRDHKAADNRMKHSKTLDMVLLPEDETKKLMKIPAQSGGIEIISVLLAALGMTMKEWTGENRTLVQMLTHGRTLPFDDVNIGRTMGWMSTAYPLMLDLGEGDSVVGQVESIEAGFRAIPGHGMGYGLIETIAPPELAAQLKLNLKPEISFNFLGIMDAPTDESQPMTVSPISIGANKGEDSERTRVFILELELAQGALQFKINYNRYEYEESTIQYLIEGYRKNIERIINHYIQ